MLSDFSERRVGRRGRVVKEAKYRGVAIRPPVEPGAEMYDGIEIVLAVQRSPFGSRLNRERVEGIFARQ